MAESNPRSSYTDQQEDGVYPVTAPTIQDAAAAVADAALVEQFTARLVALAEVADTTADLWQRWYAMREEVKAAPAALRAHLIELCTIGELWGDRALPDLEAVWDRASNALTTCSAVVAEVRRDLRS